MGSKLIARGQGADQVFTGCGGTTTQGANSVNVYVGGKLAHLDGDANTSHSYDQDPYGQPPVFCLPLHSTNVIATAKTVYVDNTLVARELDTYDDKKLHQLSPTVLISKVEDHGVYAED